MPDKTTNGRADTAFPPMTMPFGFEAFMELNRPALQAMAQMNGKMYDGIATLNRNWVAFLNRRIKEDLAMPEQLAACKTVQDMYGVYAELLPERLLAIPVGGRADDQARQVTGHRHNACDTDAGRRGRQFATEQLTIVWQCRLR